MNRFTVTLVAAVAATSVCASDSIPSGWIRPLQWQVGAAVTGAAVPATNSYLEGANPAGRPVTAHWAADVRSAFSFAPDSREGLIYPGLYQGLGIGANTFVPGRQLGTPASVYVFQGAPVVHLSPRLWLGYEWQFGAAMGWRHDSSQNPDNNAPVSTAATAQMGASLKVHYAVSPRWQLSAGVEARHWSNGNTSWPNSGINAVGASLGVACMINSPKGRALPAPALVADADRGHWMYDITAYGAWRKRIVNVGNPTEAQLCPGRFAVAGLQFSPLRSLNRWVAVGPSLDVQWDEGAALSPYWVSGTVGRFMQFRRPPMGRQLSVGLSGHAELTMPLFALNAGLGYDAVNPSGNRAFYQSLAVKAFITPHLFLNAGYRLGAFKDPENLMLGIGVRL